VGEPRAKAGATRRADGLDRPQVADSGVSMEAETKERRNTMKVKTKAKAGFGDKTRSY
jgi:hypothetical protein